MRTPTINIRIESFPQTKRLGESSLSSARVFYFKCGMMAVAAREPHKLYEGGSIPPPATINRAYNHALTPEYFHIYSKESSIVKEIGESKQLVQCLTLTTPTFSILKWISGTPKMVSAYPCTLNHTIECQMTLIIPKGNGIFFSLDNGL